MKKLWATGQSDFKGQYFSMNDCRLPRPTAKIDIICAGQSQTGVDFAAAHADYNFCFGMGLNEPTKCQPSVQRNVDASFKSGRNCGALLLFMIIADETDEAAHAKWGGATKRAPTSTPSPGRTWARPIRAARSTSAIYMSRRAAATNLNIGTLVGSYETVARR